MTIVAKFESTCPTCLRPIIIGSRVNWTRGSKATHEVCPKDASLARTVLALEPEAQAANIRTACDVVNGPATSDELRALMTETLDIIEAALWADYERQIPVPATSPSPEAPAAVATTVATVTVPKGIYRVSLTGSEKRYGVDHVNLQLVPNAKYGSVKVSEWQNGESLGRVNKDGSFAFWPSFEDRTSVRTLAILAALEIVRGSADPTEYAKAYAIEASQCWRCGADLVDEKSRERLLGPDCFRAVAKGA